jgi:rhodanese-related sulfurtransferase
MSGVDTELPPERAAELVREGDAQLVDVRENFEHEAGRIAGARHIEMDQLPAEAATIYRDRPVVFYCRSGGRSAVAVEAFRGAGYEAFNLSGGLLAWVERGLPIEPDDGRVADH